jgi:hypothetical protein
VSKDKVTLSVPAKPDYIIAVRLIVSAVAQRAQFSLDDIEDLKVASAEACTLLLAQNPETIEVSISKGECIHVCLTAVAPTGIQGEADEVSELSQYLLEALVDRCELVHEGEILKSINIYKD